MIPHLSIRHRRYIPDENDDGTIVIEIDVAIDREDIPDRRFVFRMLPLSDDERGRAFQQCEDHALAEAHAAYQRDFAVTCAIGNGATV